MIKSHPKSRFTLLTLEGIRDCADCVLQYEKTDSSFTDNKKTVYVCEVVSWKDYEKAQTVEMIAKTPTVEMLAEELIRANNDNRELRRKIDELIRSRATESEGGK